VTDNVWQYWDATTTAPNQGVRWSTAIPSGAGCQASPQPWAYFQSLYSGDQVNGYGFSPGENAPNMDVFGDGLLFGSTTTDF
jgi:hypothetical protein